MTDLSHLRLYSPGYQAVDWGFDYEQIVDLDTALAQPTSIAVLPVFFSDPCKAEYSADLCEVALEAFDLVLFTDIEWHSQAEIMAWIATTGVEHWLLHVAGRWLDETLDPRTVYHPVWKFRLLRWNESRSCPMPVKPYRFDCLLGARRSHRDFVMLSLQKYNLLHESVCTYRDVFRGHWITDTPKNIADLFADLRLQYPYVSPNLSAEWEVKSEVDHTVSQTVPWEIYDRSWFSVVCETLGSGRIFLAAEKITKCLFARRLFVVFGIQNYLSHYRSWGFETFGDVIDESYDRESDDIVRWTRAFDQVRWLCEQDLAKLQQHLGPRLDHNHHRLYTLQTEMRESMHRLIADYLKN